MTDTLSADDSSVHQEWIMRFLHGTSSFTLALVPDSGYEARTENINHRFMGIFFALLLTLFMVCLFFIIGYHIKLSQENGYVKALQALQQNIAAIHEHESRLDILTEKMSSLQMLDRAFRQYTRLDIPDDNMYLAGIGGHQLVDSEILNGLGDGIRDEITEVLIQTKILESKAHLEISSLTEIRDSFEARADLIRNTPSILPTQSLNITSGYGTRRHPTTGRNEFHDAVDFTAPLGTKIFATADGIVEDAGYHSIRGNYVVISHKYGYSTLYAHLHTILVEEGQKVQKRDTIGTMGKTGRATGVNLHYAVTHNNRKVNPLDYF